MSQQRYNFQPITDEQKYSEVITYIARQASRLVLEILGSKLPIDTITIFSQSHEEFEFVASHLRSKGAVSSFSHGATLYVEVTETIEDNAIKLLGVRQPDDSRPELGYADYPVADYDSLKALHADNPNVQEIRSGAGMPLLELRSPDFDVRGYVVEEKEHE